MLKTEYPHDESLRVSHETIYRSLFIQARGVLKKELMDHLRTKRRMRRSQHSRIFKDSRGQIPNVISIRERPAEVADRAVPGHWEGDLLGRLTEQSHRDVSGASFTLCHADQGAQQRHRSGGDGIESAYS
jgi:IS30 family transposase